MLAQSYAQGVLEKTEAPDMNFGAQWRVRWLSLPGAKPKGSCSPWRRGLGAALVCSVALLSISQRHCKEQVFAAGELGATKQSPPERAEHNKNG